MVSLPSRRLAGGWAKRQNRCGTQSMSAAPHFISVVQSVQLAVSGRVLGGNALGVRRDARARRFGYRIGGDGEYSRVSQKRSFFVTVLPTLRLLRFPVCRDARYILYACNSAVQTTRSYVPYTTAASQQLWTCQIRYKAVGCGQTFPIIISLPSNRSLAIT
jgi:hypothetical protein